MAYYRRHGTLKTGTVEVPEGKTIFEVAGATWLQANVPVSENGYGYETPEDALAYLKEHLRTHFIVHHGREVNVHFEA